MRIMQFATVPLTQADVLGMWAMFDAALGHEQHVLSRSITRMRSSVQPVPRSDVTLKLSAADELQKLQGEMQAMQ